MPQKVYKCGPDTFEGCVVLATYFIYQLVPDIRWKLQQLALGSHIPLSLFVDAASGVFDSRVQAEEERKKQHDLRRARWQARPPAAVRARRDPPLLITAEVLPEDPRQGKEPVSAVGTLNPGAGNAQETGPGLYPRLTL